MPAERVAMRQVREIIRLKFSASVATREIARRLGLAPATVRETLKRIESAGLVWPLPNARLWRRRSTPIAEASGATAFIASRIGRRFIGS
jgi:DNA-binding MarR family transcriptional regulator